MAKTLDTSLTINFDKSSGDDGLYSGQVYIKYEPYVFVPSPYYAVLAIYPIHPRLKIVTNYGGKLFKAQGFVRVKPVFRDFLNLGGGTSFTGILPMDSNVVIHKQDGFFLDTVGNPIPDYKINFWYDPVKKTIESNREVIGFLPVSYDHIYGVYNYQPTYPTKYSIQLDIVYAFLDKAYASLEVEIATVSTTKAEVMTLISSILVTEQGSIPEFPDTGAFEKPPGWPNDGSYPGSDFVLPPGTPVYEQQRVHATWGYDGNPNKLTEDYYSVLYEAPFQGTYFNNAGDNGLWLPSMLLNNHDFDSATEGIIGVRDRDTSLATIADTRASVASRFGI